jgi:hypothetical protein
MFCMAMLPLLLLRTDVDFIFAIKSIPRLHRSAWHGAPEGGGAMDYGKAFAQHIPKSAPILKTEKRYLK